MKFQSNQNIFLLFSGGNLLVEFPEGYTIVRYFPGGIAMKYGKFQGIKMFGNSRDPNKMSLFQWAFFIASLEFLARVYNCKIFSRELKCLEIPGDPNKMSLFQGAFFIASLQFPGRVYNCKIFSGGYSNEIRKFQGIKMFGNSTGP